MVMKKIIPFALSLFILGCSKEEVVDVEQPTGYTSKLAVDYSKPWDLIRHENNIWVNFNSLGYLSECGFDTTHAIADFNGDGYLDILLAPQCNDSTTERQPAIKIFINDKTNKSFIEDVNINIANNIGPDSGTRKTIVGDFNGDKLPDVVFISHGGHGGIGSKPSLLLSNNGDFEFKDLSFLDYKWWAEGATGDVDNDGDLDILLGGNTYQFLINDGKANFTPTRSLIKNFSGENIGVGNLFDYNKDGYLDLFITGYVVGVENNRVIWGSANGFDFTNFTELPIPFSNWEPVDRIFFDFDNNGIYEVYSINIPPKFENGYEAYIQVLEFKDGAFIDKTSKVLPEPRMLKPVIWLRAYDIDSNGKVNLFQTDKTGLEFNVEWDGSKFIKKY